MTSIPSHQYEGCVHKHAKIASQALTGRLSLVGNFFLNQPQLALTDPKGSLF
jgi:hypothetical protein